MAIDIGKALQIAVVSHLETFAELTAFVPVSRMYGMQPPANPTYPFIRYGFPIVGGFEATCWEGSTTRITLHAFAETTSTGSGEFIVSDIASLIVKAMGEFNPSTINVIDCEFLQTRIMQDGDEADRFHAVVEFSITAQPV
ncbi:DUF3168 domain-containing protein [Falsochrobactrum sp. TDYN1]|uniref:DUF3168 domain-containing protein n=1 Tax=Falsochrobactrum tianjinense TaxID=2706015 RepID=A0A949PNV7_9HYPH|nr:DUF3168 domain-containing protein [Falsochrobactrum sp. TDYN1]MBV2144243.1 DUF3168 domain-containing protein [Falsochrobactrum sp. TDYN1]